MQSRPLSRTRFVVPAVAAALGLTAFTGLSQAAETGDPLAVKQWGLDQVRATQAWPTSTGAGAVVAVVDSGVDLDHPDLAGQLLQQGKTFLECGNNGCGNGDWESGPNARRASKSTHGTHVTGIVAAATGNGLGVAGVARDAKILPVKVLDEEGGTFEDIALGIRYAADQGADVINLSLGAIPGAQALTITGLITDTQEAIAYARGKGSLVVAAAGNDFQVPLCGTPAFDSGALCVTATDRREAPAAYSNMGINQELQAVAGPGGSLLPICGEDVLSTVPVGTGRSEVCGNGKDYDEYAGTSMATPHVAGVAALLAAQGRDDDAILAVLLTTSRQPITGTRGVYTPSYGYGIVDAVAAVAAPGASSASGASPSPSPSKRGKGGGKPGRG